MRRLIFPADGSIPRNDFARLCRYNVIESTKDSLVQIACCEQSADQTSVEQSTTFTGFFYTDDREYILTSAYEIYKYPNPRAMHFTARLSSGEKADLHIIKLPPLESVKVVDVAVFKCDMKAPQEPYVWCGAAARGEALIMGPPRTGTGPPTVIDGHVTSLSVNDFTVKARVGEGMSGSPVLIGGKLAGMVKGGQDPNSDEVRAVHIAAIMMFLHVMALPLVRGGLPTS